MIIASSSVSYNSGVYCALFISMILNCLGCSHFDIVFCLIAPMASFYGPSLGFSI